MRAEHLAAFLECACKVLNQHSPAPAERGAPVLRKGETFSARELTILIGLEGDLEGVVFFSMSLATAAKLAALAELAEASAEEEAEKRVLTALVQPVMTMALEMLAQQGCQCRLLEPHIMYGFGALPTGSAPVLIVPLFTSYGDIDVGIALQPPGQHLMNAA